MRLPLATYRLQFNPSFGFKETDAIIEYLAKLGISDIYASPIFKAKKGSLHGYDITDHNQLNPELGSKSDFKYLMKTIKKFRMGWLQDIVPNHMAYDFDNYMVRDVLENGNNSEYANFFDIYWYFVTDKFNGKILAPFLGEPYQQALKQGKIKLKYKEGQIRICYYEKYFPIQIKYNNQSLPSDLKQLQSLSAKDHSITDQILSQQFYKLAYWRETQKVINYRRFFYLNNFIALKEENEKVFNHTHKLTFQLIKEKMFTGLRIDHIDGLYEPAAYLQKIRKKVGDIYIVIEKILALDEKLQNNWPVQGTTGYDFLNFLNGIFCKSVTEAEFTRLYQRISDPRSLYDNLLYKEKKLIIKKYFSGDLKYLLYLLQNIIGKNELCKITTTRLKKVLVEILAYFPVYRTYITAPIENSKDISYFKEALAKAKKIFQAIITNIT